jgi:transposase
MTKIKRLSDESDAIVNDLIPFIHPLASKDNSYHTIEWMTDGS